MPAQSLTLKRCETIAQDTLALHFDKPPGFAFKAGQCARLDLVEPPETDQEGNHRIFSLASAPYEEELVFATRLRDSAFKRVLRGLKPGAELELRGPYGDFTLPGKADTPVVLITGGIGVTPVRSMVRQAVHDRAGPVLTVFFANRRPEDAPFLEELSQSCSQYPRCTLVATMTQMEKSALDWQGERGHVDEAMLRRHLDDLQAPCYYIDGPPAMVGAMLAMLIGAGVDEARIRLEEFAGY
ncbi:FAD-dependent oxidoreductase [Gallaecimonas sp. GXIMD4217]|uniref:ferredoxin--NADP reductase n=1 Tax=Gallaecimonas sp. GXIMD4217 TaxID=3131927 RepID=UPI00311AF273